MEKGEKLLAWFAQQGGYLHPDIKLAHNDQYGLHFTASKPLSISTASADDNNDNLSKSSSGGLPSHLTICTTPLALTLSHRDILASSNPPSICASLVGHLDDAACTYFFLAEQKLLGEKSKWAAYIDALPKEGEMGTPLWWRDEEMGWLKGTNLGGAVEGRRAAWREVWGKGVERLREVEEGKGEGLVVGGFTWYVHW
ncbi:hypothetical protein LTS18_014710, partial [Coniosporium uncinatum]